MGRNLDLILIIGLVKEARHDSLIPSAAFGLVNPDD